MKASKIIFLFIFLATIIKVNALVPVEYTCCNNFTYSDGIILDNFENKGLTGTQLDNFENLANWTIGGINSSQVADTINFHEGTQGLKLVSMNGNRAYTDKIINNNFSSVNNFAIWAYVNNSNTFNSALIYFTSTGYTWSRYFYVEYTGLKNGWNKLVFNKNNFININGENWNNTMNKMRIAVYPVAGQNTNLTVDDLRYDVINDWIGNSQEPDLIDFKEGQQGLKLIANNGTGGTAYTDLAINNNFSSTNNFAIWAYVDNVSNLDSIYIYFTSTVSSWNRYFYDAVPGNNGLKTGWNKLVFNRHNFKNNGGESWDNITDKVRLRIYSHTGQNAIVTFDDLRHNMTGNRAKLMLQFDDGWQNVYDNGLSILEANNQTGVSFVITSYTDLYPEYLNLTSLKSLQSAGWDISSHTVDHADLVAASDSIQTSELNDSYNWLVANKFQKSAGFLAYPYGTFNDGIIDKAKKRYIFGRGVMTEPAQQHFSSTDDAIQYIQKITSVHNDSSVQSVKDKINDSINAKLLGIVVFHGIVKSNPSTYEYLTSDLQTISNYIKSRSSDVDVVTYSDYVIPEIKNFTPVINKATRIYSNGSSVLITNNKYDEYMPNMTVMPSSDYIDIGITDYNETGGFIRFNESSSNNNLNVTYNIGDRIPNQIYRVIIYWYNGTKYQDFNVIANSTGYINYNSEGFGNARYQEISEEGIIDTSFSITLPIGYTFLRFNASNSSVINLDTDGQNGLQPIFNITNNGNIIQSYRFYLLSNITNISTYADLDNNHTNDRIEINSTSPVIIPNLNPGSSQNVWILIDANRAPATNINATLMINSS